MGGLTVQIAVLAPVMAICAIIAAYRLGFSRGRERGFSTGWALGVENALNRPVRKHWDIEPK